LDRKQKEQNTHPEPQESQEPQFKRKEAYDVAQPPSSLYSPAFAGRFARQLRAAQHSNRTAQQSRKVG
jgi:hypothetical protein